MIAVCRWPSFITASNFLRSKKPKLNRNPKKPRNKIKYTSKEYFRVYKYIGEEITDKNGKLHKFYYANRAYTIDGNWYEKITFDKPSTAVLETTKSRWGAVKGCIIGLDEEFEKLQMNGWKKINPARIGTPTKFASVVREKEFIPRRDLAIIEKHEKKEQARLARLERLKKDSKVMQDFFELPEKAKEQAELFGSEVAYARALQKWDLTRRGGKKG